MMTKEERERLRNRVIHLQQNNESYIIDCASTGGKEGGSAISRTQNLAGVDMITITVRDPETKHDACVTMPTVTFERMLEILMFKREE